MLIIDEKEMKQAVNAFDLMDAVEDAFRIMSQGDYTMPERIVAESGINKMLYMPCYGKGKIGTKILSAFPKNPSKGKPFLDGIMYLNDGEIGQPLALLNGRVLTRLRTGAVGGVAMKHLSKEDSKTMGLVGCGVQGYEQVKFACSVRPIEKVYLHDPFKNDLGDFVESLKDELANKDIEFIVCDQVDRLAKNSDIIVTATGSNTPVLPNDASLLKGKCIVAIGSWRPDMQEIPDAIWSVVDNVYTELPYAFEESGDLHIPLEKGIAKKDQITFMNDFIRLTDEGRRPDVGETILYKSVGMSLFDLTSSYKIYDKAVENNRGMLVEI